MSEMKEHLTSVTSADINGSFEKQKAYKWEFKKTTASYRLKKLKQFKDMLLERKLEVAEAVRNDFGKPQVETDLTEIMPVLSAINRHFFY